MALMVNEIADDARFVDLPGRGTAFVRVASAARRRGRGEAPTLMLLHGLGATGRLNWAPSILALQSDFRIVSVDQRGHGRGLRGRFTLEDAADDAVAVADALGLDRFIPVGYSMGGPVAQLIWKRHADRIGGMVLCATARNFGRVRGGHLVLGVFPVVAQAARLTPGFVTRPITNRILMRITDPADHEIVLDEMGRNDPGAIIEAAGAVAKFSSHDWITRVDVPTAVVVTAKDTVVPPHRQRKLAAAIPHASVFEVQGDHAVCVAAPERFVPALRDACLDVVRRAAPNIRLSSG